MTVHFETAKYANVEQGFKTRNALVCACPQAFPFFMLLMLLFEMIPSPSLCPIFTCHTSLVAQTVKRLSTMWETWVWSLGWEDSLEKEMATHSSTLALKTPWTEELGAGYYPWGRKESGTTERFHFHLSLISVQMETFRITYK